MGAIKRWNGSWVDAVPKYFNASWNQAKVHKWDGAQWVEIYPGIVYTLSGENINDNHVGGTHNLGLRINNNGYVYSRKDGIYAQLDTGTDWVIPRSEAATTHYARLTQSLGDTLHVGSDTLNAWHPIDGTPPEWYYDESISQNGTFELSIATDSGGTNIVAQGTYQLNMNIT